MVFFFFIISLILLTAIGVLKYFESKNDKPSFLSSFLSSGDQVVKWYIESGWRAVIKYEHSIHAFISTHIPHYSGNFYGKFKSIKNSQRDRLIESFRGKRDFPNKGQSSLFLWHISPNNGSEKEKSKK